MKQKSVDDLIRNLSSESAKVGEISWEVRGTTGMISFLLAYGGMIFFAGKLNPVFLYGGLPFWAIVGLVSAVGLTLFSSYLVVVSGMPGRKRPRYEGYLLFSLSVLILFATFYLPVTDPLTEGMHLQHGFACSTMMLVFALGPFYLLSFLLVRLAPTHPARSGRLLGLAAVASSLAGVQLYCQENLLHALAYHIIVGVLLMFIIAKASARRIRW